MNRLLDEAPESETRALRCVCDEGFYTAFEFFDDFGFDHFGLLKDGRPIYVAVLTKDEDFRNEIWTVVTKNPPQFSLYKYAKKYIKEWSKKHGTIYATMRKDKPKNMEWTQKLGFHKVSENNETITFEFKGE